MKVISKLDYTTWAYEFTCYTCKSKLCANHNDLKYRVGKRYYSSFDGDGPGSCQEVDEFYIICSVCSTHKHLIPNEKGVNISYLHQQKVKEEYIKNKGNK